MTLVLPFEPLSKPNEIDDELAFARQRDVQIEVLLPKQIFEKFGVP